MEYLFDILIKFKYSSFKCNQGCGSNAYTKHYMNWVYHSNKGFHAKYNCVNYWYQEDIMVIVCKCMNLTEPNDFFLNPKDKSLIELFYQGLEHNCKCIFISSWY